MADLITTDWEVQLGDLLLGGETPYALVGTEGLLSIPEVISADRGRLQRHGGIPGEDFLGARTVVFQWEIYATGPEFSRLLEALATATSPGGRERPVYFRIPGVAGGGVRCIFARPRKRDLPVDLTYFYGAPIATVEWVATDPRIYDAAEHTVSVGLPAGTGEGLEFPATDPLTFGTRPTAGSVTVTNAGNFPTPARYRIDGPCVNPRIENVTTGAVLAFRWTLEEGQWLDVDTNARTVRLNGTANRYEALYEPGWADLAPGDNEIAFRAATSSEDATLSVTWRSAWV